jgi:exopolyphosphatase / guanosine-5'-triphosphate,3'-diphosphate pyrophosphatase
MLNPPPAISSRAAGPVAVIDIGSNSIRLLVYESAVRSPTPLFNEKVLCGLGRKMATTGRLGDRPMERALQALGRFRAICAQIGIQRFFAVATEAVRRAENGRDFIMRAENACGCTIRVIDGREEAQLAAAGVAAGFVAPDGIAGDLGGGSLELIDMTGTTVNAETSVPLGSLNLIDVSGKDFAKATAHADRYLQGIDWLARGRGRPFYAIGGTWRAVARLQMIETDYPLSIVHHYTMTPKQIDALSEAVVTRPQSLKGFAKLSSARQEMLPHGLLVLRRLAKIIRPSEIVFSAFGVREGVLYQLLPPDEQARDPLIAACEEMAGRRGRSVSYGNELFHWMEPLFRAPNAIESPEERRLRLAACLLSDVGWRGHPDYRGEKVLGLIAQSSFVGVDHAGRSFLALAVYYVHETALTGDFSPALRRLVGRDWHRRAQLVGIAARAASKLSASMPGVLNRTPLEYQKGKLVLHLPESLAALDGEALRRRLRALAQFLDSDAEIRIGVSRSPAETASVAAKPDDIAPK